MSLKDPKNQKLLNDFMAEHAPLINKQVKILASKGKIPSGIEHEDLHMHGFHGLMDAMHKYDHDVASKRSSKEGENTFTKYAERRIQGKILDHLASQDQIPKVARTRAKNLATLTPQSDKPED